jgi:hypothetical protein
LLNLLGTTEAGGFKAVLNAKLSSWPRKVVNKSKKRYKHMVS